MNVRAEKRRQPSEFPLWIFSKKKNKLIAALACAAFLPATAAFAQEANNSFDHSIGIEAFYASALDDMTDLGDGEDDIDGIDLYGVSLRYTIKPNQLSFANGLISPEFYGIFSVGTGDDDWSSADSTGFWEKQEYTVTAGHAAVGANLRFNIASNFSAFVGARLGLAYEKFEFESRSSDGNEDLDDDDIGLLYGIGIGAEWNITENHAVTVGIDYIGSTAEPEISGEGEEIKTEKQSYVMFSVGYKYTF